MSSLPIKNTALLEEALTHRSYLNEHSDITKHNERLEFLGDAVLELVVSEFLFDRFPDKPEGELTAYRAALVRTNTLAEVSQSLNLGEQLRLSKGETVSGGRINQSLLANTFEAVLGAIYLDAGYKTVVEFLTTHLFPKLEDIIKNQLYKDFKSSLQEFVQSKGHASPEYEVIDEAGPDHDKTFTIVVKVDGNAVGQGIGRNKQTAQQDAARAALEKLTRS